MYRVLHIPTGCYLYDGNGNVFSSISIEFIKNEIKDICDKSKHINWNKYNEHIGLPVIEAEFEIMEVD